MLPVAEREMREPAPGLHLVCLKPSVQASTFYLVI